MPTFKVKAFKCGAKSNKSHAWCMQCEWFRTNKRDGSLSSTVCAAARKHTQQTGHETRIDIEHQRRYRVIQEKS